MKERAPESKFNERTPLDTDIDGADIFHAVLASADESVLQTFFAESNRQEAESYVSRWWERLLGAAPLSDIDVAHDRAQHEKREREARETPEYAEWERLQKPVLDELRLVRDNPESPEAKEKRPLLLIMGGAMQGVYSAGQVLALQKAGFESVFTNVLGISAGSGTATYFASGQAEHAVSLFVDECAKPEFFDWSRMSMSARPLHGVMDTKVIASLMRDSDRAVDQEAIRQSASQLDIVVTNVDTGSLEFLSTKEADDMVALNEASAAIPLFQDPVDIGGKRYIDGAFHKIPIKQVIEKYQPTSVMVLPNMAFNQFQRQKDGLGLGVEFLASLQNQLGSASLGSVAEAVSMQENRLNLLKELISEYEVPVGVFWSEETGMKPLETDKVELKQAAVTNFQAFTKTLQG